jgi:hypothetical protein
MFPATDNNHAGPGTQSAWPFTSSRADGDGAAYDSAVGAAKVIRLLAACPARAAGCMLTVGGQNNNVQIRAG